MVQGFSNSNIAQPNQQNKLGTIKRLGMTPDGRMVYQAISSDGEPIRKMSIAQKDCAVFEKSYADIVEVAPKLQKYAAENSDPQKMKQKQKISKWVLGGGALIGGLIPAIFAKKWQILSTIGGTIAGFALGGFINSQFLAPPGYSKFIKATQNISKIDARPIEE
ncbi:MAG: hypothetical protein E7Z89_06140 [Cyanobacteria bacterium SIG28]|nr:hypothetical protein [Cyanobacteria bacterium SIG28]